MNKQAKILSKQQQLSVVSYLLQTRKPDRNLVIFLLSIKAGLRAKEISSLTWTMICDATGDIGEAILLPNSASKGKSGGVIYINEQLKDALRKLKENNSINLLRSPVILSERDRKMSPQVIVNMMYLWYRSLGFDGCSSHSGRRTFITNAAKKISSVGGSIRDVQALARHKSLQMTQKYIEFDIDAQKRIVQII